MRLFCFLTLTPAALLVGYAAPLSAAPPNIVVFISDDLGRAETSVYGSSEVRTPAMEQLAADGMTFNNAYVASPSCCPNRFSLLTGLMPARHGAHPNHSQPKPGTQFLVPILKSLGYHIASFGKVAHGRRRLTGADHYSAPPRNLNRNVREYFGRTQVDGPVCLFVGDRRPHVPWIKESRYDPKRVTLPDDFIDTPSTREHWARYLTDITDMDRELGQVYAFARQRLGDDFIFVFTSDHGGQWPLGKWNLYDSGTRIPLTVVWPSRIAAGTRSDAMVSWVDIIPTLIDLAGGAFDPGIDGRSFAAVLNGERPYHRSAVFTTHTGDGRMNIFPIRSVRVGPFKLIHNLRPDAYHTNHSDLLRKDGAGAFWDSWEEAAKRDPRAAAIVRRYHTRAEWELFDLNSDPAERQNLADSPQHKEELTTLQTALRDWAKSQGDDLRAHTDPYLTTSPLPNPRKGNQ